MTSVKFNKFKKLIYKLLMNDYMVFIGVHSNDWWDFQARAVQLTGYFCHTFYVPTYYTCDKTKELFISTVEADGEQIAWHNLDEYKRAVETGKKTLVLGYFKNPPRRKIKADLALEQFMYKKYNHKANKWLGITEVLSWFGNFWKAISNQLGKINPMSEKDKYICSGHTTLIARIAGYNIAKGQEVNAVTPTEFMNDKLLIKEAKTEKGE
jgi:hypothetical protein